MVPGHPELLAACVPGAFGEELDAAAAATTARCACHGCATSLAIGYAQNGYPLVERIPLAIASVEQLFREHWPTSAAVYLPGAKVPAPGSLFTNKTMAATYIRILREAESAGGDRTAQIERARKSWSHGFVAEAIDQFCRTQEILDVSGNRHRGVLTAHDMATWQPRIEEPLTYRTTAATPCASPARGARDR